MIKIVNEDITKIDADAIVNAANEDLLAGGSVCQAIFDAAGRDKLQKACGEIGHCDTGSAVKTPSFKLQSRLLIHAVGPIWQGGENNEPLLLYGAYMKSLKLAMVYECRSIAFPLISAGIYGYPKDKAWRVALQAIIDFGNKFPDYKINILFAIIDIDIIKIGYDILDEMVPNNDPITLRDFEEELIMWSDAKISREIDRITTWGSAFDVREVLDKIKKVDLKNKLILRAIEADVDFPFDEISCLEEIIDLKLVRIMIDKEFDKGKVYLEEELEDNVDCFYNNELSAYVFTRFLEKGSEFSKEYIIQKIEYAPDEIKNVLIRKCLNLGIEFSVDNLTEFSFGINEDVLIEMLDKLIERKKNTFSYNDIMKLEDSVYDIMYKYVLRKTIENGASYPKTFIMKIREELDVDTVSFLVENSLTVGEKYSEDDICKLYGCITDETEKKLLDRLTEVKKVFSYSELKKLEDVLNNVNFISLINLSIENGYSYYKMDILKLVEIVDKDTAITLVKNGIESGVEFERSDIKKLFESWLDDNIIQELIKDAIRRGNNFTYKDIVDMDSTFGVENASYVIQKSVEDGTVYSKGQIIKLVDLIDVQTMDCIVLNAINKGEKFTIDDIDDLENEVSYDVKKALIDSWIDRKQTFSSNELDSLYAFCDSDTFLNAMMKSLNNGTAYSYAQMSNIGFFDDIESDNIYEILIKSEQNGAKYKPADIVNIANWLEKEKLTLFVIDYVNKGNKFKVSQLAELGEFVSKQILLFIIDKTKLRISKTEFRKLEEYIYVEDLLEIEDGWEIDSTNPEPREILDVVHLIHPAQYNLVKSYNILLRAKNAGSVNFLGRWYISEAYVEDTFLTSIKLDMDEAINSLLWLKKDLKYIVDGVNVDIKRYMVYLNDFIFNWKLLFIEKRKINYAIKQCDEMRVRVEELRDALLQVYEQRKGR